MKGLSSTIVAYHILLSLNSNSSEIIVSLQVILSLMFKREKLKRFNFRMHHKAILHWGIFS